MPNVPSSKLVNDNLAQGLDRNDGKNGRGGTATPAGQIVVHAHGGVTDINNIPIEELEDSPIIERAEQGTCQHHYRMSYEEALTRLGIYGRGALVKDSGRNYYRILSSTVQYQRGGKALFSTVGESVSFDNPPDEFMLTPVRLGLDIMKHPRYFYNLMPTNQIPGFVGTDDTDEQIQVKQAIIRAIQAYRDNPFIPTRANLNNLVGELHDNIAATLINGKFVISKANPNYDPVFDATRPVGISEGGGAPPPPASSEDDPNPMTYWAYFDAATSDPNGKVALAKAAAGEIIGKLWRMEDAPMVNSLEITLSEYWFRPPPLDLGGYIQDPRDGGLPDYFYSTEYPPDPSKTIFDYLSYFNPQCFAINGKRGGKVAFSSLRDADTHEYNRTWFKVTKRWLLSAVGAWDGDVYTQGDRPSAPEHYRRLLM